MSDNEPTALEPPFDAGEPAATSRTRTYAAGAAALVLIALVAGFALWPRSEAATPVATTSTTTTTTSTTSTIPALPGGTFEIATAKPEVATVKVFSAEPADWAATPVAVATETPPLPPASQPTVPARDALPRVDYPIQGRYAVADGWEFSNPGPFGGDQPFTMSVLERRGDWAKVSVPVRPNGTDGWVALSDVDLSTTQYRIEIRIGERMVRVFDDSEVISETQAVVGADATQTPTGRFYVTDKVLQNNPAGAYGPIALATDGYSEMMDIFATGVPVVALHGTNKPQLIGQALSNGCIRVPNEIITMMAETLPLGTPVDIWP